MSLIQIDPREIAHVSMHKVYTGKADNSETLVQVTAKFKLPEASIQNFHTAYLIILRNKEDMVRSGDLIQR